MEGLADVEGDQKPLAGYDRLQDRAIRSDPEDWTGARLSLQAFAREWASRGDTGRGIPSWSK